MTTTQLELWNSSPEPWAEKMKRDAFELSFPSDDYDDVHDLDDIEVTSSWQDARESWGCGNGCYSEHQDAKFWFEVKWWKKLGRNNGMRMGHRYVFRHRRFSGAEAVKFFRQLMEKGSK